MTVRDAARHRHDPEDEPAWRATAQTSNPRLVLQPRPRGLRVHRVEVGQGGPAAVPLLAAQGHRGRRRERLRRRRSSCRARSSTSSSTEYLKARFKPFRDKETPSDYGRNLAPNPGEGPLRRRAS
ncbi:MAG: hypothetical protein M0C28_16540 [Candidatus Moduliflexus flocculans]|nr:hypothetical protein [Candidatus Moduliflexus flocculans]